MIAYADYTLAFTLGVRPSLQMYRIFPCLRESNGCFTRRSGTALRQNARSRHFLMVSLSGRRRTLAVYHRLALRCVPSAADSPHALYRGLPGIDSMPTGWDRIRHETLRVAEAGVTPDAACTHIHRSLEYLQTQTDVSVSIRMCACTVSI